MLSSSIPGLSTLVRRMSLRLERLEPRIMLNGAAPEVDVTLGEATDVHAYDFGTVTLGQSGSATFTVANTGDADLVVSEAALSNAVFTITPVNGADSDDDWTIAAGETATFTITFTPDTGGDVTGTLILTTNDSDEASYEIAFTAFARTPAPEVDVTLGEATDVHAYDMGSVKVAKTLTQEFTVHNGGDADLIIAEASGLDGVVFSITPFNGTGGDDDWIIAPGATATFVIAFTPNAAGNFAATLVLTTNDADESSYEIALTGNGYPNASPTLASLEGSAAIVVRGDDITLTTDSAADSDGTVVRVLFYYDTDGNGILNVENDEFLGADTTAADGWSWTTSTSGLSLGTHTFFAVAQDEDGASSLSASVDVGVARVIAFGGKVKAVYTDADNDIVTLALTGPGVGTVYLLSEGPVDAGQIVLTGTTDRSTLKVTLKKIGAGLTTMGDIEVTGSLKLFSAKLMSLAGDMSVTGVLKGLVLDDVSGSLTVGAPLSTKDAMTLRFDQVSDFSIHSLTPIKSLTVSEWLDTNAAGDTITAPWLKTLKATGDKKRSLLGNFAADLSLTDASATYSLTALTAAGWLEGSVTQAASSIKSVTVGGMRNSSLYAGLGDLAEGLPVSATQYSAAATIQSVTIKGMKDAGNPKAFVDSMINSNIAARNLGTLKLVGLRLDNGGAEFGLAAATLKKLTVTQTDGTKYSLPDKWLLDDGDFVLYNVV